MEGKVGENFGENPFSRLLGGGWTHVSFMGF
jgi:hypothetical protein